MSNLEDTRKDVKEQEAFEHHQKENGTLATSALEGGQIVDRERLEKRLLRKLDARFLILIVIYILNYIDRQALSAAKSYGVVTDLGLKGQEYPTLLSILYVGYILMQIPSNMLVQYSGRPSLFLPGAIVIWGVISLATAFVKNFGQAVVVRFFLGFVEAAFFPGAILVLSSWYRRNELGLRITILYCGSLISNAFGPLIAYGILETMEGAKGMRAWHWLFIIEGALTCFVGVITAFILPDFPHNSRGFSATEKHLAETRMTEDTGMKDETKVSTFQALKMALCDYKLWVMALSLTSMTVGLSFNQFFPQLTASLGYAKQFSLLLCAPPFAFAAICAFFVSRHSDKTNERYWHIVIPASIGIIGFIIGMSTQNFGARYFALFLQAQSYSGFVCFLAWVSATFARPSMKRAVSIAFVNAFSQLGNVAGAYCFDASWAPTYAKSYAICISTFVFAIAGCTFHRWTLARLNKRLEARDEGEVLGQEHKGLDPMDFPAGFRYTL
ncbi:uncharacterized protein JCM6883_004205 [Sporobolomyces salmoneus]|uniref:uncharacterized protein n=1 Tax=Sporobolomyces salmoneus TaxID=183962 RepID=UPI0031823699